MINLLTNSKMRATSKMLSYEGGFALFGDVCHSSFECLNMK